MTTCTNIMSHLLFAPRLALSVVVGVSAVSRVQAFSWRLGCGLQTGCWRERPCLWGGWERRWRSRRSWRPGWSCPRWARSSPCSSGTPELWDELEQKERIRSLPRLQYLKTSKVTLRHFQLSCRSQTITNQDKSRNQRNRFLRWH